MKHWGTGFLLAFGILIFFGPAWSANSANFVGSDACVSCHEKQAKSSGQNIHWKKAIKDTPVNQQGCESCHGSGAAHVDKGGGKGVGGLMSFSKIENAYAKSAVCLRCHETSKKIANWDMGKHKTAGVSCESCHDMHGSKLKYSLGKKKPNLFFTCHKDIKLQASKQSRHPMREGKVKCTDCHSSHGSFGPKQLIKDTVNDTCYQCHTEKRGPFAFEHEPVAEDCGDCHTPHGSNHNRLLVRKAPMLCQSCHTGIIGSGHFARAYNFQDTFGGAGSNQSRAIAKGCMNCHGNIHGSMQSPYFER
jgi:DmsE family decaheme c-type cytochrome